MNVYRNYNVRLNNAKKSEVNFIDEYKSYFTRSGALKWKLSNKLLWEKFSRVENRSQNTYRN